MKPAASLDAGGLQSRKQGARALYGAILAALAAALLVPPPAAAQGPPPGGECTTQSGPATLSNVYAKPSGGEWEPAIDKLGCLFQYQESPDPTGGTTRSVTVSFTDKSGNQDISSVYPEGTELSFDVSSPDPQPLFFVGAADDPLASFESAASLAADGADTITVQGKTTEVNFAFQYGADGPNCAAGTMSMSSFIGGAVMLEPLGGGFSDTLLSYRGFWGGTNAQTTTLPQVSPDGQSVEVTIQGCGDDNPATEEGFFKGFMPIDGTAQAGLNPALAQQLANLGDASVDQLRLTQLTDNGQVQPGADFEFASQDEVAPEQVAGSSGFAQAAADQVAGIAIDYHTSFSSHRIVSKVSSAAVRRTKKVARECKRARGRLAIVRKDGRRVLVCKKRKR